MASVANTSASTQRGQGKVLARGMSLVEMLCTLAITAVLLSGVLPMLNDLRASQLLHATAALLETDIQLARSQALASGESVRLSVQVLPAGGSCYVIHTGPANACRCNGGGEARCDVGITLRRLVEQPLATGITLAPVQRSILFDAGKGTVTPTATFTVTDREGRSIHQIVNIMGRVRSCTPNAKLGGLRACA